MTSARAVPWMTSSPRSAVDRHPLAATLRRRLCGGRHQRDGRHRDENNSGPDPDQLSHESLREEPRSLHGVPCTVCLCRTPGTTTLEAVCHRIASPSVSTTSITVIVLAAGGGTRMKSKTMKVLHPIAGRSMIGHVLAAVSAVEPHRVVAVVGHQREQVGPHIQELRARRGAGGPGDPGRHRPRRTHRLGGARRRVTAPAPSSWRTATRRSSRGRACAPSPRTTSPPAARSASSPGSWPTRSATDACCATSPARSPASSSRRTPAPSRPRSTRSTAASSPSTRSSSTRRCRG